MEAPLTPGPVDVGGESRNEPLRIGLVGAGGISAAHLGAARRHPAAARFSSVADPNTENARVRCERYGIDKSFPSLSELLREDDVEAVVICTSHDAHASLAIEALEAGRHVLVEKPMATSMADCRAMVRAAEESARQLMIGQCERYQPSYAQLREKLRAGELGRLQAVRIDAMQDCRALPDGHWLLSGARAGGGVVISVAVHRIDLARFLAGEVVRVSAHCRTVNPRFTAGAEDLAVANLEFSGGATGQLFASWNALRLPWSESLLIIGERGVAQAIPCPPAQMAPARIASLDSAEAVGSLGELFGSFQEIEVDETLRREARLETENMFANQLLHFAGCCRSGAEPWSSGRDNLGTMATIFAIYESARRGGEPVEVAELLQP